MNPRMPYSRAGDADDHLVLDDQRRDGHRVAGLVVRELDVEQHAAGLHVERDEVRVERDHEQPIAEDAEAAIDRRRSTASGPRAAHGGSARSDGRSVRRSPTRCC